MMPDLSALQEAFNQTKHQQKFGSKVLPAGRCVVAVMHRLEALRILEAKMRSIEEERHAELAENEDLREAIDTKAEAQALTAVFDFLKDCKIAPSNSLLRIFKRYLRASRSQTPIAVQQQHSSRGRAKRLNG
jgi:hypothetical protein